ncbi:MAG: SPOR domain-containing protein [Alistipes sp.]|nr:SPOR domain-containing protein [Alistipes sp.]
MKQQIDLLIANTLLREGEISLPSIGSLILRRRAAKRLSAKRLQMPYHELCFTSEQRGVSLVALIAATAEVTAERAEAIYAQWLAQSCKDRAVTITALCRIEQGIVTTFQEFETMANPKGRGVAKINPHTNRLLYAFAALCLLFAVGIAGYTLYTNGIFDAATKRETPKIEVTEVVEDSTAPATTTPQIAEPQPTPQVAASDELLPLDEPQVCDMKRGASYAVWGVYNERANAEAAVERLAKQYEEFNATIYIYGERYMVALGEFTSRAACARYVEQVRARARSFNEVWVYTNR